MKMIQLYYITIHKIKNSKYYIYIFSNEIETHFAKIAERL